MCVSRFHISLIYSLYNTNAKKYFAVFTILPTGLQPLGAVQEPPEHVTGDGVPESSVNPVAQATVAESPSLVPDAVNVYPVGFVGGPQSKTQRIVFELRIIRVASNTAW